jgi:branched-chain amino acid transport system ATP-binding protein
MTGQTPVELEARAVVAGYEPGLPIVRGASVLVRASEIVALLGPNGAGKSTLVKAIAGLVPMESGQVWLGGYEITGRPAYRMANAGLAFVPQTENVFARMTVAENLELAGFRLDRAARRRQLIVTYEAFPDLARLRDLAAGRLSGGQRQMLAVARALLVGPRVLVLDEPSASLSPRVAGLLFATLGEARARGVAVLMVEQNARAALALANRAYVMAEGMVKIHGPAAELRDNPDVARLYLGGGREP